MAKGSNNIRGRSSDASKPYDVSNSFVKRVATRVTELLPQPSSWFSRWMSPSDAHNANEYVGHSLSATITSRPPATSRAELNLVDSVDHHAPAAKKPRTNRYNSPVNQKFLRNDQYNTEDLSPIPVRSAEPVAGPSSRDTRPELVASTPAVPAQQMTAKVNGDDCSETSESTSGCSSLVPQAQSSARSLGGSRYHRSIPGSSSIDALDRRRPSFNTTTFNSPLRASMRARLGSSPFYSGRTMYGGSSQACEYARLVETSQRAAAVRRVGPTVRPPPSHDTSLPLSSTAKRILDALEQFSTPMIDAKKMPVVGSKRSFHSMNQPQRRYAELSIPSTPDLLRVKRRERLQQSTLDARQVAAQSSVDTSAPAVAPPAPAAAEYTIRTQQDDSDRKRHTGKVKTKEKLEEEEPMVEVKLPSAVLAVTSLPKIDIAIPPPPPAAAPPRPLLPTVTEAETASGSKFVFSQPTIVTSPATPVSVSVPTTTFKFSEPLRTGSSDSALQSDVQFSSDSSRLRTSDEVSGGVKKMNKEEKKNAFVAEKPASDEKTPSTGLGTVSNKSASDKCHTVNLADEKSDSTQKWECSKCKNNNSSTLEVCVSCQTNKNSKPLDVSKNNVKSTISSGFDNFYKKPTGTWECSTCLIQNKSEVTKCVACESSRPDSTAKKDSIINEKPSASIQAPSETKPSGSGFGDLFKKPSGAWTCDECMITNNADKLKCAACETPKPGATIPKAAESIGTPSDAPKSGNGFGNIFKKPSGSWTCDVCMINNNADKEKCAACEAAKPGSTISKAAESSGPKFSFGIPSAVSASGPVVGATFSFGIPKGETSSTSDTKLSLSKINKSDSAQTPTPTFSFGIPKAVTENSSSNAVTSSTSSKPTFQFGSVSSAKADTTNPLSSSTPPTNIFGNLSKKSTPEVSKPSEMPKPAFSISSSTPSASSKPETSLFGMKSDTSSTEQEKPSSTPTPALFGFGTAKAAQNDQKTTGASSTSKPAPPMFMFGAKQEGLGSNLPSSTTNTLSSSSPSNIFKFGDTKTVSSGSGATSISSVSTQASVMTPKPNNMFSFGSNSEKKTVTFGATQANETPASNVSTSSAENKPTFGSFGASARNTSTFGNTNSFGSSALASKEQTNAFAPQTTPAFGTTTNTSTSSFPSFGQTQTNAFQVPQQENKPSPVFTFGASAPQKESGPSGGFVFNPSGFPAAPPQQNPPAPVFGFGNTTTASAPSSTFNFEPKFGSTAPGMSPFNASASAPTPVFGAPTAPQAPSFGEQAAPAPVFNFGSQAAQQTPANPVFEFGSNQSAAPAPAPTFVFGSAPAAAPAPANPPAFDPNIKPTFNFTQGAAAPVFSAVPTLNSPAPPPPPNRKIRKAVRRSTTSSVRN